VVVLNQVKNKWNNSKGEYKFKLYLLPIRLGQISLKRIPIMNV
jgi:hypothetical protein